jgi:hypothetical protein
LTILSNRVDHTRPVTYREILPSFSSMLDTDRAAKGGIVPKSRKLNTSDNEHMTVLKLSPAVIEIVIVEPVKIWKSLNSLASDQSKPN